MFCTAAPHATKEAYCGLLTLISLQQGEPGKPGEKGLVGRPGLRVSTFSTLQLLLSFEPHKCIIDFILKRTLL